MDADEGDSLGVNEVLWSFMSEGDRLAEMGRLLGRLRFAQEGNDCHRHCRHHRGDDRPGPAPAR